LLACNETSGFFVFGTFPDLSIVAAGREGLAFNLLQTVSNFREEAADG